MTLSQRSFNLALSILINLVAFKLLTPLVLPWTWNQTIRSNQINHLAIQIQLIIFFLSCSLVITTPLLVGFRSNLNQYNLSSPLNTLNSKSTSPPLWAIFTYLLITFLQILFSFNFIYTNSNSTLSFSLLNLNLTSNKIQRIQIGLIISYGIIIMILASWGSFRKGNNGLSRSNNKKNKLRERGGEIQLLERDEVNIERNIVSNHHEDEEEEELERRRKSWEEFEEQDLGNKVEIQKRPGDL